MIPNLTALEMLLRIYFDPNGHPDEQSDQACYRDAIAWLLEADLIGHSDRVNYSGRYTSTERARVYVEHIRNLPLPVHVWAMPSSSTHERLTQKNVRSE